MKNCLILLSLLFNYSFATSFGVIEDHVKWDKKSIKVCWGNESHYELIDKALLKYYPSSQFRSFSKIHKQAVRSKIEDEFTIEQTGIEYTGWNNCSEDKAFDVVILTSLSSAQGEVSFRNNFLTGRSSMGRAHDLVTKRVSRKKTIQGFFEKNEKQPHVYLSYFDVYPTDGILNISPLNLLVQTALHEFGHLSGLRHEQSHPDSKDDHILRKRKVSKEPIFDSAYAATSYDANSIMNYGFTRTLAWSGLVFEINKNQKEPIININDRVSLSSDQINITDETLFEKSNINESITEYKFKIKLSTKDKHSLRCLYKMNPFELVYRVCNNKI